MAQAAYDSRTMRRRILAVITPVNLGGAVLVFVYFRWVDHHALMATRGPSAGELLYSLVAFAILAVLGYRLNLRWSAPLRQSPPGALSDLARRRALQLPFASAAVSAFGWMLATIIWGIVWPLIDGSFKPHMSARIMFGTLMAGSLVVATVFFLVEHRWREILPGLFPEGGITEMPGAPRMSVRARLLVIFLLISVIPIAMLGIMAYNHAVSALAADAAHADAIMRNLLMGIVFIGVAGVLASIRLAWFVARSVAQPLATLERAMADVERGRLDTRCPVVTTDEIGRLTEGFNRMVRGLQERELLRETFGKYVSQEIRDEILAGRVSLEGQAREATILFSDLRDFTTWVEATDPRDVVRDLNSYFTEMEAAIRGQGGLVLQYIGDEIEAVFGAPIDKPDHAGAAVRAAVEMRRRLSAWNAARAAAGKPALRHGIGIHTGTVIAGNIGSSERLSYALVGDPVNLASRIQGLTKDLAADVLVSGATRERIGADVSLRPLPAVKVKGRAAEVEVYALG